MTITTLPQDIAVTPEMEKVFAALANGATTVTEAIEQSGVVKARVRVALVKLEAAGVITSVKGTKPGQATIYSVKADEVAEDLTDEAFAEMLVAEAEAAQAEAEGSQADETPEPEASTVAAVPEAAAVPVLGINAKKRVAAQAILKAAGDLVASWGEEYGDSGVTADEAAELFAKWLQYTPGKDWDARLGKVPALKA